MKEYWVNVYENGNNVIYSHPIMNYYNALYFGIVFKPIRKIIYRIHVKMK